MVTTEQEEEITVILSAPQEVLFSTRAQIILDMAGQGGGKSQNIGYHTGFLITNFPRARGFIGANTYDQLSGATLKNCFEVWRKIYGLTEYHKTENPQGAFVYDKRPPQHFQQFIKLKNYKNVMCFYNGAMVILGSLENYEAQDGKEFAWAHLDETKDTREKAVKEVITGRLRQRGLWVTPDGELTFEMDSPAARAEGRNEPLTNEEALTYGWKAWNPLFIHTSPADGVVTWLNNWFELEAHRVKIKEEVLKKEYGFFHKEDLEAETCVVIYSAYHNKDNLPPGKLERQEKSLGPDLALKLVYGYPFSKTGGEYFSDFQRLFHVKPVAFKPGVMVHQTWDFNVVPYMTCLLAQIEFVTRYIDENKVLHSEAKFGYEPFEVMQIRFFREYCFESPRNSNEAILEQFRAEHPPGSFDMNYYGDGSGLGRIPGIGKSNFQIIEDLIPEYLHNDSRQVRFPNIPPLVRRDLLNHIFAGRRPSVEIIIDPSCEMLIKDMEECKLGVRGKVKANVKDEKTGGSFEEVGHASDAAEYLICEVAKHLI